MDKKPVAIDPATGETCFMYFAEYEHDGATWGVDFFAKDDADARRKLQAMADAGPPCRVEEIIPAGEASA